VNDTLYKSGGPIFLQLWGEEEASPIWLYRGQASTNYAQNYNALNILLEHRFYGESHPRR
jgi:Serine carboxypeptidase S28